MAEGFAIVIIFMLGIFFLKWRKSARTNSSEKEDFTKRFNADNIVGKSTFNLTARKSVFSDTNFIEKIDIEVPLEYEPEINTIEEQEELEQLGLSYEISSNITFEEMMEVVNEVENVQPQNPDKAGRLLYENENTEWVDQMASTSSDYQKRIVGLIDLHLVKLRQNEINQLSDDEFRGFDIGEYVK